MKTSFPQYWQVALGAMLIVAISAECVFAEWVPDSRWQPVWAGSGEAPVQGPDLGDSDLDKCPNWLEAYLGTDPNKPDTDGDFILDGEELLITGTDPLLVDSDGDTLSDYRNYLTARGYTGDMNFNGIPDSRDPQAPERWHVMEYHFPGVDWTKAWTDDADGDGLSDAMELMSVRPHWFHGGAHRLWYFDWQNPDSDGDGVGDEEEFWDLTFTVSGDADGDGLLVAEEAQFGWRTSPTSIYHRDSDGDGLYDGFEQFVFMSNPLTNQSDFDGLNDMLELKFGSSPRQEDADEDGANDLVEYQYGTNPWENDSDGDGLGDGYEIFGNPWGFFPNVVTNPLEVDTDGDHLTDAEESFQHLYFPVETALGIRLNPTESHTGGSAIPDYLKVNLTDSDGGGIPDAIERFYLLDPHSAADDTGDIDGDGISNLAEYQAGTALDGNYWRTLDWDYDGMSNIYEITQATRTDLPAGMTASHDPLSGTDGVLDPDADGRSHLTEHDLGTDPYSGDTDGDGLEDSWELAHGLNPNVADAHLDLDGDGLTNAEEFAAGTHPGLADTDGDGFSDGIEFHNGSAALLAAVIPIVELEVVGGQGQSAVVGTLAADPLSVRLRVGESGIAGFGVAYELVSGAGILGQASVNTGGDGTAQTSWTAPGQVGDTIVRAWPTDPRLRGEVFFILAAVLAGGPGGPGNPNGPGTPLAPPDPFLPVKWEIEYRTSHGTYDSDAVDPEEPDGIGAMQAALVEATTSGPADETLPGNASRACWPVSSVRLEFYEAEMFHLPTSGAVGSAYFLGWENSGDAEWQSLTITGTGGASNGVASYLSVWEIKRVNAVPAVGGGDDSPPELVGQIKVVRATPGGVAVVEQISPEVAQAGVTFSGGKLHLRPPPVPVSGKQVLHAIAIAGVEIIVEDGQAGVIGDRVRSNQGASAVRHFVTPKKTAELDEEYLKFTVADLDAAAFSSLYEWKIEEGTAENGDAAHKKKVERDKEEGEKVLLQVVNKSDQSVAAEMIAWVVWAKEIEVQIINPLVSVDIGPQGVKRTTVAVDFNYEAVISPAAIFNLNNDVPALHTPPSDPSQVAESQIGAHVLDGGNFENPQLKWDLGRQWRWKSLAPTLTAQNLGIPPGVAVFNDFPNEGITHQTTPNAGTDSYPSDALEGNDTSLWADRSGLNPYSNLPRGGLNDLDPIRAHVASSAGQVGDIYESRKQFREFIRVQLGAKWYLVSPHQPSRVHIKLRKVSENEDSIDHNGDGDTDDEVWIQDGAGVFVTDDTDEGWDA